ncbi:hypothetical protein ACFL96_09060 [Thermoproteota archaeon]
MGKSKVIIVRKAKRKLLLKLKHMLNKPSFELDKKILSEFLHPEELEAAEHLGDAEVSKKELTLFYPGCGLDIVQPLIYSSRIAGKADKITFILADRDMTANDVVSLMLQLTGNHNYSIKRNDPHTETAVFRFKDRTFSFVCKKGNVLESVPKEIKQGYDVYFERAFELFRENDDLFMPNMISLLNKDGLMITDAGLSRQLSKDMEKIKLSPKTKELGFYKNLSMYRKK